ncbi:LytR family transcriptional regulator [Oscillospiraceae bacterium]|uniref:LytTR family DNA-binding domain-containing protein n=1 Tax=Allofournierella sp. TaxID=1940256 RepID=UPI0015B2ED6B|nr:LytR family transcriptional regulator [Oscillospiraceae bacterium]
MRIEIIEDPSLAEVTVTLRCPALDSPTARLIASLRAFEQKLTGVREGRTFLLDAADILYADTADKKVFLYTTGAVYETPLRLYELEERLCGGSFLRAGKSALVNFDQIQSLRPEFGGRLELTLKNGERLLVNRQYVPGFKQKLGLL